MASIAPLIRSLARQMGLDPAAVLAVAAGEGGFYDRPGLADIGDEGGGGSYGPFQLYAQGALPANIFKRGREFADDWAWSPEGIKYALSRMVNVGAKGQRGDEAVRTIIEKFERPANIPLSIQKALARYDDYAGGGAEAPLPIGSVANAELSAPNTNSFTGDPVLDAIMEDGDLLEALLAAPKPQGRPSLGNPSPVATGGGRARADVELFYDPLGAYKHGQKIAPIGGHGSHLHAAFSNPKATLAAIQLAHKLGLSVRENPYVDPVDPVHTKKSWHYETFPGMYQGKRLGRAVDVSGDPNKLRRYFNYLRPMR